MRPKSITFRRLPGVPAEMAFRAKSHGGIRRLVAPTLSLQAHPRGSSLQNTQATPERDSMRHTRRADQVGSIFRRVVLPLHHQMLWSVGPRGGASRSANQSSAVNAVLDAIEDCLDFVRASRCVKQRNWNFSAQGAVGRGEPPHRLLPVA
jgi:hypothetical protein